MIQNPAREKDELFKSQQERDREGGAMASMGAFGRVVVQQGKSRHVGPTITATPGVGRLYRPLLHHP